MSLLRLGSTGRLVLLLPAFVAGCTEPGSDGAPRRGRFAAIEVAVTVNGRPMPGVDVRFTEHSRTSAQRPVGDIVTRPTSADGVARADSLAPGTWLVSEPYLGPLRLGPCTSAGERFHRDAHGMVESDSLRLARGDAVSLRLEIDCPYAALLADSALRTELDSLRPLTEGARWGAEPRLTGKVLVADEDGIDPLTFDLPEELRPRSAAEVGTVAFVLCQTEMVGRYVGPGPGGPASRQHCNVFVVDRARREALARTQLSADPAGQVQTPAGHVATDVGNRPNREIVTYLLRGGRPPP